MWISIDAVPHNQDVVYLPKSIAEDLNSEVCMSFGKKTVTVKVETSDDLEAKDDSSFDNPMKIKVSSNLKLALSMPASLVYQMKSDRNSINIGPVIGLLFGKLQPLI